MRASALAGPLGFGAAYGFFKGAFGADFLAALPLALAAVSAAALRIFRNFPNVSPAARQHGTVWYAAAALSFIAIAIPLQLQKEWELIGWALQGAALIQLWRKLDHPGSNDFALSLLALVTLRLLLPDAWDFHPHSGRPVLNWLMYAYLVPAARSDRRRGRSARQARWSGLAKRSRSSIAPGGRSAPAYADSPPFSSFSPGSI